MNRIVTKEEAIELIYHSYNVVKKTIQYEKKMYKNNFRSRELLDQVGEPDKNKQIILVSGSKGKGSTASFISSLLTKLGFKTGLFTSPHLISFNERIQLNGESISDDDLIRLANLVQPSVVKLSKQLHENEYLGPIAISLAIAMIYFSENNCDYIVLEVGKGGLYDDTNVVTNKWAVITPILDEHMEELGPNLSDVARHKLGIVNSKTEAVTIGKQKQEIIQMINETISFPAKNVSMYGNDFCVTEVTTTDRSMQFNLSTEKVNYTKLTVPLIGNYQSENLACAIQTCEHIVGYPIEQSIIQQWLKTIDNPGKCEIIHDDPIVIIDAAIHRTSAQYVLEAIKHFDCKKIIAIVGLSMDKDYRGIMSTIAPFSKQIIVTNPTNSYKPFSSIELVQFGKKLETACVSLSLSDALEKTLSNPNDGIVILGNHSFIAEAKQRFESLKNTSILTV